ncbi:MAG: 23S rRNA (uracil(1939)-C(5))-methyltransferase RlmD, partial [Candidatus Kapaibacteriota bacterium]
PKLYEYRNKMEFTFGNSRWLTMEEIQSGTEIQLKDKHFALGFHIPERFDKVLNVDYCHLQDYRGNKIINEIRSKAKQLDVPAYNLRTHRGFLRNLILRWSHTYNELMVNLVTTSQISEKESAFLEWFKSDFSNFEFIQHLIHTTNDSFSPTNFGDSEVIKGSGYIYEDLLGIKFRISPFSFFQVNTLQANRLVELVVEYAEPEDKIVWDLYSGSGIFALTVAKSSKCVIGIELLPEAVQDGIYNARLNNINQVEFISMDLHSKRVFNQLEKLKKPEIIIIDPPRTGIHKNLLKSLLQLLPDKIVYVSCNPTTMARDCFELQKHYEILDLQPVDMFPQTYHIESVALLVKRKTSYGSF